MELHAYPALVATVLVLMTAVPGAAAPERLAIYYGYPSLVNGAGGDIGRAAAIFVNYDHIVWGDGLELDSHPANSPLAAERERLKSLMERLRQRPRRPRTYGYIDLGK